MCVLTSIKWKAAFTIFTCWGSDCLKFHHVLAFTLTESLMGAGKNGSILQLINCSKCRSCPSLVYLCCRMTGLPLCPLISCFSCGYCSTASSESKDKNILHLLGISESRGEKRKRWKDSRKVGGGWESDMSIKKMKTVREYWGFCCC